MTDKNGPISKNEVVTLSEGDISSQRSMSRRSLLGTIGLGAGAAAAAVIGTTVPAAARSDNRQCWRDRDRGDRATVYCDRD